MKPKSHRHNNSVEVTKAAADKLLKAMFDQGRAQFGDAVKSFWFYEDESRKNPYKETPLHDDIERNLIAGYHKHLYSLNA